METCIFEMIRFSNATNDIACNALNLGNMSGYYEMFIGEMT